MLLWSRPPGDPLVSFPSLGKKLAPQGEISLRITNQIRNLPPHPSRLRRATFPYPLCRFATSPLDKGSRPPRGRLFFWGGSPLIRPPSGAPSPQGEGLRRAATWGRPYGGNIALKNKKTLSSRDWTRAFHSLRGATQFQSGRAAPSGPRVAAGEPRLSPGPLVAPSLAGSVSVGSSQPGAEARGTSLCPAVSRLLMRRRGGER